MNNLQKNSDTRRVDDLLRELFSFHRFGIKPGLENITTLLTTLGDPHLRFPSVHVAGTNGKGTVCSTLASILTEAGYKTGLYTSPHILRFNERIRIDGKEIADADIARLASAILPETRAIQGTFFEATTAMAFAYFAEQNVDIAIIETGLGGRLDSTNVLHPALSIITSIDLEHTHFLGTTLPQIATEKAGIIKPKVPVLVGEERCELRPVFKEKAQQQQSPLTFFDDDSRVIMRRCSPDLTMTLEVTTPHRSYADLFVPLPGAHTARNIGVALAALDFLADGFPVSTEQVANGLSALRERAGLRGRIERLSDEPLVVLDVAHNAAGIKALSSTLDACGLGGKRWNVVFAAMDDKAIDVMLEALEPLTAVLFATAPHLDRALAPAQIAALAAAAGIERVCELPLVADAVEAAIRLQEPMLIVGSFYLADEALSYWNSRSEETL